MTEITRDEWVRRYAARVMEKAALTQEQADEVAKVGAEAYEESERAAHNKVMWCGESSGGNSSPEDVADEELSYWDNDEP